jgi:hypothetical protein
LVFCIALCSGEGANARVNGTWAQADPGASESIQNSWENKAGTTSKHGLSPKAGETWEWVVLRKENRTAISAFQLIALKAEDGDCEWLLVFEHTDSAETYYYL